MAYQFEKISRFNVPVETLFSFHERKDALELLSPPFEKSKVIKGPISLNVGTEVIIQTWVGLVPIKIVAVHTAYEKNKVFIDEMTSGPFKKWAHIHKFNSINENESELIDSVNYEIYGPKILTPIINETIVLPRLRKLFNFRHQKTAEILKAQNF